MTKANASSKVIAQQLLELHLKHEMASFSEASFFDWIKSEIDPLFNLLKQSQLNDWLSAQQIKDVIQRNTVAHDIPGAVAEIAGEAASRLFTSQTHKDTLLNEVFTSSEFEAFVDKILELEEQRKNALDHLIDLPIYGDLISGVVFQAITRYIYESNILSKKIPGISSMLKISSKVVKKTVPKLGGAMEESIKSYITNNLDFILSESKSFLEQSMSDDQLKSSAMDFWDMFEGKTFGELQQGMDSIDLSEFVVLGYEFWLRFRGSDYFKHCYETIVDYLFEQYGDTELSSLLDDLAITPTRIVTELEHFAPQLLTKLKDSGQLENLLRRRLEGFYNSEAALACLT